MNTEFRGQIYNELNLRETEDLLEILHTNDHEEWSDAAFEVIKEILIGRLGEIPPQEEFVEKQTTEVNFEDDGLEEWEAKLLDDENQPEYYDILEVLDLKDNMNKTARAVIVVNILTAITSFQWVSALVWSFFKSRTEFAFLVYFITFVFLVLSTGIAIAATYFPLKALTHILRILMEMEFNSRKTS